MRTRPPVRDVARTRALFLAIYMISALPVARLRGDDPADPAAGIVHVARVAGDQVDVHVADRLLRGRTHGDAEVAAARVELALDP